MRQTIKIIPAALGVLFLVGCVVREEPRRRVVVYQDPPPPAPVEVVPVAPGPEVIWVPGIYLREGDHWGWHRGYYRHR
jgi:hypothetical protein